MEISKNSNLRPACCSFTFDKVRNKLRVVVKSCSVAATQRSFCAGYIHKYFGVIMKLSLQLYWDPNYSFHIILQNNPKSFGALTRKEMPNGYLRDRVITLPQSLDLSLHILFFSIRLVGATLGFRKLKRSGISGDLRAIVSKSGLGGYWIYNSDTSLKRRGYSRLSLILKIRYLFWSVFLSPSFWFKWNEHFWNHWIITLFINFFQSCRSPHRTSQRCERFGQAPSAP